MVEERGFDPILTEDEQLIFEAILSKDRLPGLVVCVADDNVGAGESIDAFAFVRFGDHIEVSKQRLASSPNGASEKSFNRRVRR